MKKKDIETELRNLKFTHLTESEMVEYCDEGHDQIRHARMEAHLKQCFICERQLEMLREERAALKNRQITDEDVALVDRLIEITVARPKENSLEDRLAEYLGEMVESWRIYFMKKAMRGDRVEEVWQWQSKDGRLQVRATLEKNAEMTIHFSSNEIDLDGARLNVHLGKMSQEITLQRISESEVYGKVDLPRQHRRNKIAYISIKAVSGH
ncbi:MAG: hypothetical protein WBV94_31510 [Blastocatellia bacterium]